MANLLVVGNSTNGGTAITTDSSGTLDIKTGTGSGTTAISIDASQAVTMSGNLTVTGSITGGSISVANSLRAWVNFNGTGTVTIRASFNVSSITDNGTGDYTINFTSSLTDANYSVALSSSGNSGNVNGTSSLYDASVSGTNPTASLFRIKTTGNASLSSYIDPNYVFASVFR